ncbi:MAG: mechanosensitive ion channel family protein [Alloprevotella sp.]|nr:mechanosensitive ion channel family protein [Alloprevotella sp.]MBR1595047.1 mechanosensitive ion channel family protein [Alloprevotella sp.]
MKRILTLACFVLMALHASAVLNERDLAQSLSVLRVELKTAYLQQKQNMARFQMMNEAQHMRMLNIMQKSSQIGLMLYSQKDEYVFDLTYACHEATQQYMDFKRNRLPYDRIAQRMHAEVERYDSLIAALEMLPPSLVQPVMPEGEEGAAAIGISSDSLQRYMLDEQGQADREECLLYAKALRNNFVRFYNQIDSDKDSYQFLDNQLSGLHAYAQKRYQDVQQSIFSNSGTNYFMMLMSLPRYWNFAMRDIYNKYSSSQEYQSVDSEWRGNVVWGYVLFVVFYLVLAIVLSISIVTILMRRVKRLQTEEMRQRRVPMNICLGVLIFAISIMIVRLFLTHNFYVMASNLLVEYAWLLVVIFVSLLVRLNSEQIRNGFRLYTPIVLMGLIIIIFRIVFIPNTLVNLLFPPIVLGFTYWQWRAIRKHSSGVPRSDMFYTWISFAVMLVSCISAWVGYTLMAVEAFIWWLFQLTAIETITLAFTLLGYYERGRLYRRLLREGYSREKIEEEAPKGRFITQTWAFDLIRLALVPIAAAYSVLLSIYLAADVFDLSATVITIFITPFLDVPDVIQLSLFKLVVVAALYFVFRYITYATKAFYRHLRLEAFIDKTGERRVRTNEVNLTLGYNIISILSWGLYIIISIVLLKIPKSGISIVTAGLATGIGFAMKDILNNFFYGIQLMAGRLRVGDYIECDGVQGKVESITYQSTQIITLDDCVMAFLNSTLFAKNFKNLTRNHSYELIKIPIGVAYGTNVDQVRTLLKEELMKLQAKDRYDADIIDPNRGVDVLFDDFGADSVNLLVIQWILVTEKTAYKSHAREIIYNTLRDNHIEIPFPQREVKILNAD